MKKTTILSAILAGSLMAFGGFGCSHNEPAPAQPNSVSGQATTPAGDVNAQGQMNQTPSSTAPADQTTPSGGTMDQRQPVKGTMDQNQSPSQQVQQPSSPGYSPTSPSNPSDTTKPDTTKPDQSSSPGNTPPPK
jgi:hypothetical protein